MDDRTMIRILDPDDEFYRRLGLVMKEDENRFGVWIEHHPEDFVHWVSRSLVEVVPGTWHDAPGKGEWFIEERVEN